MKNSEIIKKYSIRAQKHLGQNFLVDDNIKQKIIDALELGVSDHLLEIGPGYGALTCVAAQKCEHITAVERDPKLVAVLKEELGDFENVDIVHSDILKFDIDALPAKDKYKVLGNLPYYITSKIIFQLIDSRAKISSAVLTMQKEVAERIAAGPGSKVYGRLTVGIRLFCEVEHLFDISAACFYPAPDVKSSVLRFTFRDDIIKNSELVMKVIKALFSQRRKSIANNLKSIEGVKISKQDSAAIISNAGLDPKSRAEDLAVDSFVRLSEELGSFLRV